MVAKYIVSPRSGKLEGADPADWPGKILYVEECYYKQLKKAVLSLFFMAQPGIKRVKGDDKCQFCKPSSFDLWSEVFSIVPGEHENPFVICDECILADVLGSSGPVCRSGVAKDIIEMVASTYAVELDQVTDETEIDPRVFAVEIKDTYGFDCDTDEKFGAAKTVGQLIAYVKGKIAEGGDD